jgi:uncharacterized protein
MQIYVKHGVSFHEASIVFNDPLALTYPDTAHSSDEIRFTTFGLSASDRLLIVAHVEIETGIRIISARKLDRAERKIYEQG